MGLLDALVSGAITEDDDPKRGLLQKMLSKMEPQGVGMGRPDIAGPPQFRSVGAMMPRTAQWDASISAAPEAEMAAPAQAPAFDAFATPDVPMQTRVADFFTALGNGAVPDREGQQRARARENQTYNALVQAGLQPNEAQLAMSSPQVLTKVLGTLFGADKSSKGMEWKEGIDANGNKVMGTFDPATGEFKQVGGVSAGEQMTADDYTKGTPQGMKWVDPRDVSKGLEPIPGYQAIIPSDVAGKVAMMDVAAAGIKETRKTLERPWSISGQTAKEVGQNIASSLPGVSDVPAASGDIGIAKRNVRMGIESALRVMTGAAAPETEVTRYAALFMPGLLDTQESAKQKLDALENFMALAKKIVTQGRGGQISLDDVNQSVSGFLSGGGGGAPAPQGGAGADPMAGGADYKTKYGLE